jgi:hypothetical protein
MMILGEAVVDNAVTQTLFRCDLEKCKGACCCLTGGRGAPLTNDEAAEIREAYPTVKEYLSAASVERSETAGCVEGTRDDYATMCIDDRECVFAVFDNGIARCALEKAHMDGRLNWRKPLSCHLFPARIRHFGRDFVRYEQIEECQPGRDRGSREEVPLHVFLREPLERKYGAPWYRSLLDAAAQRTRSAT